MDILENITLIGDPTLWFDLFIICFFLLPIHFRLFPAKNKRLLIPTLLAIVLVAFAGFAASEVMKEALKVPRPCAGLPDCPAGYSLPSSHSTVAFSIFSLLFFMSRDAKRKHFFFIPAILVAISRVMLGVHTLDDIFLGAVTGMVVARLALAPSEMLIESYSASL